MIIYICDLCGTKSSELSTEDIVPKQKGHGEPWQVDLPDEWGMVGVGTNTAWQENTMLMCDTCSARFGIKPSSEQIIPEPIAKKLLRLVFKTRIANS